MIREAGLDEDIYKATFVYRFIGPMAEHNYLCACCRKKSAVLEMHIGILQPCWECQRKYKLIRLTWIDRILGRNK
ncbi:MAG TPA: hypothetical protein VHM20_06460 [Gammaproteobacteria bacterium]|jgi:hypothetical protein|nr:hypothetical protein [Gammaproteobacteria bacterium]